MAALSGHCLCRSVTFEVRGEILRAGHCHCESCRRATSSPVTTFFTVEKADAEFTGEPLRYYASSPGVSRSFCSACGSPMSYETEDRPGQIDFYVAALGEGSVVDVDAHWYWNERVTWLNCVDDLPKRTPAGES